jgi:hypothetical protein
VIVVAASFKLSKKGVGELLKSGEIAAEMLRRAEAIEAVAVARSPVGGVGDPHPGQYKASWGTKSGLGGYKGKRDRAIATVFNTAGHARFVEYGNEHYGGHHVLLRAAEIGGRDG